MTIHPKDSTSASVLRSARKGFAEMLSPLAIFAFECGINISDLTSILRETAVLRVGARQLEETGRMNISRIAAVTGISRFEISRLLKSAEFDPSRSTMDSKSLLNRILSAWYSDPKFLTAAQRPKNLKIFGRGPTFESLVRTYGRGIPVRAILDELFRVRAIEYCGPQEIFPKKSVATNHQITSRWINILSSEISDLLNSAMRFSGHLPESDFVGTVAGTEVWSGKGTAFRSKYFTRAQTLFGDLQENLVRKQKKFARATSSPMIGRLRVTISYVEESSNREKSTSKTRRNLRRDARTKLF